MSSEFCTRFVVLLLSQPGNISNRFGDSLENYPIIIVSEEEMIEKTKYYMLKTKQSRFDRLKSDKEL